MPTDQKRRRPPITRFSQAIVRWFFRILFMLIYRIRVHGLENYPAQDGLLVCLNHQSNLDPLIAGVVCPRRLNYLGKKSLFKYAPLAWFISWNDTIPIDREAGGISGMKETLRRIKSGESVVMFPEGTRSPDGKFYPLKLGFCAIAKRTRSTLVPIGFDGAYQAYPRDQPLPRAGRIHAVIGEPIPFEEYQSLDDQEMADLLELRIRKCFDEAQARWQRSEKLTW